MQEAERSIAGGGADLYLLDVMLPDGSGFGLCEHIRDELGSNVPIIFLIFLVYAHWKKLLIVGKH